MRTIAASTSIGFLSDVLRCQYELTQLDSGAAVYAFTGFPKHYICPYCFEQALLQVLQYRRVGAGYFACPGCKTSFPLKRSTGLVSVV
jgi:transposase-like protein